MEFTISEDYHKLLSHLIVAGAITTEALAHSLVSTRILPVEDLHRVKAENSVKAKAEIVLKSVISEQHATTFKQCFAGMRSGAYEKYTCLHAKFFKYGRTETIRPVSKDSVAFKKAMDDADIPQVEKAKLCKEAISHQNHYKLQAMNGEACDRPLFGLYIASKMAGIHPKIFQNKALFAPDQLSTSQSPYQFDSKIGKRMKLFPSGGAFGPQRPDGYGVYYLFLADDAMTIHISSFRSHPDTDSTKMSEEIVKAVEDIKNILKPTPK